jgi:hypothetical protein
MAGRLSHMRKRLAILEKAAAEIAEENDWLIVTACATSG